MGRALAPDLRRALVLQRLDEPWEDGVTVAQRLGVSQPTVSNYENRYPRRVFGRRLRRWSEQETRVARALLENPGARPGWLATREGLPVWEVRRMAGRLEEAYGADLFEPPHGTPSDVDDGEPDSVGTSPGTGGDDGEDGGDASELRPPVAEGDELVVGIVTYGADGDGVAKVGKTDYVLFVPNTQIGDRVRVRVRKVMPRFAFADIVRGAPGIADARVTA